MDRKQLQGILYVAVFLLAGFAFAYQKGWIMADFESVTPKEAYELAKQDPSITVLDVRTAEEYAAGHIAGASLIPLGSLSQDLQKLEGQKNKKIIVYCKSGNRSVSASRILKEHGYTPINVKTGFDGWIGAGLPSER